LPGSQSANRPLLELAARLKPPIASYRPTGWRNHSAVLPFPRLCGFPTAMANLESADIQAQTFSSSAFLQSFSQLTLARSPQQTGSSHGLCSPSAQVGIEDPRFRRASTPTLGPPPGFVYPLDGLSPSTPSEFCFTLTALLGFSPSKLHLLSQGTLAFPLRWTHMLLPLHLIQVQVLERRRKSQLLGV
jgi:hypothetical protein